MTNKKFQTLSPEQKRVEIAKDVIKALGKNTIVATKGYYFKSYDMRIYLTGKNEPEQLQKLLKKFQCEVCAKGALFVADVAKINNFEVSSDSISSTKMAEKLEYFEEGQLNLIETAFEGSVQWTAGLLDENDYYIPSVTDAISFYAQYFSSHDRMIGIMQNIIDNKGEFIPSTYLI